MEINQNVEKQTKSDEKSIQVHQQNQDTNDTVCSTITNPADKNQNGMSDSLEEKIENLQEKPIAAPKLLSSQELMKTLEGYPDDTQNDTFSLDCVPVIITFPTGNFDEAMSLFVQKGGVVKYTYNAAVNGFAGQISAKQLQDFCSVLQSRNTKFLVEEDSKMQAQLYYESKDMNLRPYTWNTLGYRGDPSTAVAVIDTGIDASHVAFAPGYANKSQSYKITGWMDEVGSTTQPTDDNGHGSHCAGIAAGSGAPVRDASNNSVATWGMGFDYSGYYIYNQYINVSAASFNVTTPGTVTISCVYDDYTPSGRVYASAYLYHGNTLVSSYVNSGTDWTDNLTCTVSLTSLGSYNLQVGLQFYGSSGYCENPYMRIRGIIHWPFNPPALGTSNLFQGVAPNAKLVGVKVLDSSGSGYLSNIINGINWAINNKKIYNITVMSMSLGGSAGQTSLIDAVNNAVKNGIVTVVAAGNSGPGANNIGSPGDADDVITVAAMSDSDNITYYSSQGGSSYTGATTKPDIAAPGGSSYNFSTFSVDSNVNDAEGYFTEGYPNDLAPMMGTSMATPAVAGAADLVIQALGGRRTWSFTVNNSMLVKALLLMTATETYPLLRETYSSAYSPSLNRGGKDVQEGYGRINVDAAIEACTRDLTAVSSVNATLSSSAVNSFAKHAMAGYAYFCAGTQYKISLHVPAGADFDLYVYSSSPTAIGEPVIAASSTSSVVGHDETIFFTPSSSGVYYIVAKAVSGSGVAILSVPPNFYAPKLTMSSCVPTTGNQSTPFNFSVTYSDKDNNPPCSINLVVNGAAYPLSKQNPADINYTDGCKYGIKTYLQPGTYSYSFNCSDSRFTNSTSSSTLVVTLTNSNPPKLLSSMVSPESGLNTTSFNFSVSYTDLDNNMPASITITINASTHNMLAANPLDSNAMDGKTYYYTTTLGWGLYRYQINCSDGKYQNATGWISGPEANPFNSLSTTHVVKNVAIFEDNLPWGFSSIQTACTALGITYTVYGSSSLGVVSLAPYDKVIIASQQYTAFYTILTEPTVRAWIESYVSSGHVFEMHYCHYSSDSIPGVLPGGYTDVWDPENYLTINASFSSHPIVAGVTNTGIDSWGYSSHEYLSGLSGKESRIIYDNTLYQPRLFTRQFGSGLMIYVGMTVEFAAYYGYGDSNILLSNLLKYSEISSPKMKLNSPVNGSTYFHGNIIFNWTSMAPPFRPITYHWQLSNSSSFTTIADNVWGINEMASNTIMVHNITVPYGTYYWRVQAVWGVFKSNWTSYNYFFIVRNDYPPKLNASSVYPETGNQHTNFTFQVNYSDQDNNTPVYVFLSINNTNFLMAKQTPSDNDYLDGCIYVIHTSLQPGHYSYQFKCSDGLFENSTPLLSNLTVTIVNWYPPNLGNNRFTPSSGDISTLFTFTVTYYDADNNQPTFVTIVIDNVAYTMIKCNPGDMNYVDGCDYSYTTTLGLGPHVYLFVTNDGNYTISFGPFAGPTVLKRSIPSDWGACRLDGIKIGCVISHGESNPMTLYSPIISALQERGATVTTITSTITSGLLDNYDILWFDDGGTLSSAEQAAIIQWVDQGGAFIVTTDGSGSGASLALQYNIYSYYMSYSGYATQIANHPITYNVTSLYFPYPQYYWYTYYQPNATVCASIYGYATIVAVTAGSGKFVLIDDTSFVYEYYMADNYRLMNNTFGWLSFHASTGGNNPPTLSSATVIPSTGNQVTPFQFRVTYTDIDNDPPVMISVFINGTAHPMQKLTRADYTYSDGCIYVFSTTLSPGDYEYQFTCSDGTNLASTVSYPLHVSYVANQPPTLTDIRVSPSSGSDQTLFTFMATYSDPNDDSPVFILVIIDGIPHNMTKQDQSVIAYVDGCVYIYTVKLTAGMHNYTFSCSDGYYTVASNFYADFAVASQSSISLTLVLEILTVAGLSVAVIFIILFAVTRMKFKNTTKKSMERPMPKSIDHLQTLPATTSLQTKKSLNQYADSIGSSATGSSSAGISPSKMNVSPLNRNVSDASQWPISSMNALSQNKPSIPVSDSSNKESPMLVKMDDSAAINDRPILVDIDNTAQNEHIDETINGKRIDIFADIKPEDLQTYRERWYTGPIENFSQHFFDNIIGPRMDVFTKGITKRAILILCHDMITLVHGVKDPKTKSLATQEAIMRLVRVHAIDPNLPAPHLTDKGLVLRISILEISPEQAECLNAEYLKEVPRL